MFGGDIIIKVIVVGAVIGEFSRGKLLLHIVLFELYFFFSFV